MAEFIEILKKETNVQNEKKTNHGKKQQRIIFDIIKNRTKRFNPK